MDILALAVSTGCKRATKYIAPDRTLKITRKRFKWFNPKAPMEFIVTFGKPNFKERKFIKLCKKAKVKFPVKKIQMEWFKPDRR